MKREALGMYCPSHHHCKGASALEHEMMCLRLFWSHRPAMRFYYPSWMIVNCHQLVASLFINTILPHSPTHSFPSPPSCLAPHHSFPLKMSFYFDNNNHPRSPVRHSWHQGFSLKTLSILFFTTQSFIRLILSWPSNLIHTFVSSQLLA